MRFDMKKVGKFVEEARQLARRDVASMSARAKKREARRAQCAASHIDMFGADDLIGMLANIRAITGEPGAIQ
jgi:hypothetical protein